MNYFDIYVVVSGIVSFVLSYWFIPTELDGFTNFTGSLYMLIVGFIFWPMVLAAAIKVQLNPRLKRKLKSDLK